MLRQRRPRQSDPKYLKWLRTQPCACGCHRAPPCDAAHLRSRSLEYDKESGYGKPDDRWALPLNHWCHMAQHRHNELQWWADRGVEDPFALCITYYQRFKEQAHD
jgi:hypothetical protein